MATIDELISSIELELEGAERRRDKATMEVQSILEVARQEGRPNLEVEEDERVQELFASRDKAKTDIVGIKGKLANANKVKAEELESKNDAETTRQTNARKPAYDEVARVGDEERTYRPDSDPHGKQFLADIARQFAFQDVQSAQRLSQHMREERVERAQHFQRATGTGAFSGLTVPQYLTDLYAPSAKALRPFADICNRHPLPAEGMTVNISRITTASTADIQATQNTAVDETDMDDTLLSPAVQTAAGQQTVSRQAIERGTGIEDVTMQDLFNSVATTLDSTLITQGTTGLSAVAQANTYTDSTPTAAELHPKILAAASASEAALLAMGRPSHAVMHSRRWYWLSSQLSSTWPYINTTGIPTQAGGTMDPSSSYNSGVRGVLPSGLLVVTDNNIATTLGASTNEDEVYVVAQSECHLWEDDGAPMFIRAEQTKAASLGVLLVAYQYFAYTFARYSNGAQKVSGTGLVTPSF